MDAIEKVTKVKEAVLVKACLEACGDYVEKHGEIIFPLIIKPASSEKQISSSKFSQKKPHATATLAL